MVQIALLLAALISFMLAWFVLLNNPRSGLFRWYCAFGLISAGWIVANALTIPGVIDLHDTALLGVSRLITPLSLFSAVTFYYFLERYTSGAVTRKALLLAIPSVSISLFSFSDLNVYVATDGMLNLGPLFGPYIAVLLFNIGLVFHVLFVKRHANFVEATKARHLLHFKLATLATLIPVVILGTFLPIFSDSTVSNLAPLFSMCFLGIAAYSMIKHRLFDLRLVVVRSITYVLALVIFASAYGFLVFGLVQWILGINFPVAVQMLISGTTSIAALTFHGFKLYFDKKTSSIFYQDAYDTEELYDEYNRALVSTIDLDELLHRTANVVVKFLKPEYCSIGVKDGGEKDYRIVGTVSKTFDREDVANIRQLTANIHSAVILVDDLSIEHEKLEKILRGYDATALVRLTTDFQHNDADLGFMVLGSKKSGNPYVSQDIKVLETLANELIIALQNALRFEEIERFNETLQQKVTEATRQLRESNKKLKQLNDSKDDFIGMASHQLRTPLTAIKGYVSLVMDGDAGKVTVTQKKLLQQAFSSSQKMVYLVADLLNVSRLKTGKFVIERVPTNLVKLIKDEMAQLQAEAKTRSISLQFDMPADFPALPFDETKTRQVIMNFLDNAIYYTPAGGHVMAELKELPKSIEFRVIDDGIGVPKDDQYHMFTKFYRAKNAQRTRPDGTGLGLYMAQKVIVAQGGAVIFNSEEGKGSVFGFSFPKDMPLGNVAIPAQTRD